MKFQNTFCSQCGEEFGPGDHGYSHCSNHRLPSSTTTTFERELMNNEIETTIETEDGVKISVCQWDDGGAWLHLSMKSGTAYAALTKDEAQRLLEGLQAILQVAA
jgi:hypothetical protein